MKSAIKIFFLSAFIMLLIVDFAEAKARKVKFKPRPEGRSVLLMDAETGQVLYQENGFDKRYPASLTKMMTIYVAFDALRRTNLTMHHMLKASANVARQPSTNISLKKGEKIRVEDAVKALIVRSANDVATMVGENFVGSEEKFARIMTSKARKIGMDDTYFSNASGLPNIHQISTAYDMAILARALQKDFPEYYHYFNLSSFKWNGRTYKGHNKLMKNMKGVDGLKTGYTRASGFNLASSYVSPRNGKRYIGIYMGAPKSKERRDVLADLFKYAERGKLQEFARLRKEFKPKVYALRKAINISN